MLLKCTKTKMFLFTVIHQLLGTVNDTRKKLYHIADDCFETWTQKIIQLLDKVIKPKAKKFNWRAQKK